jgi:hypothetical protein
VARRRCKAKTKRGTRCMAAPLKDSDRCLAHSDAEVRESTGFIPDNGKGGRRAVPRATEVQRRLVEENVLAVQRPYWRILGYDVELGPDGPRLVELDGGGAKLFGESKDGCINVSDHEDLAAMMAAAEKLQDRAFGRPKQSTEITGAGGGPVELVDVPVRRREVHDLLADRVRRTPAAKVGTNGHSNGKG